MARSPRLRSARLRRLVALSAVVAAGVGGLALEHTATGASTGNPVHHDATSTTAHLTTTTHHEHGEDAENDEADHDDRHCHDDNGDDVNQNKHCRVPSGGTGATHDRDGDFDGN